MNTAPTHASVVVIGGGVMGLSTAFHLAEAGHRDVVVIEADQLGSGSTSKAAGGVRLQFSDAVNIELALRSMDAFEPARQLYARSGFTFCGPFGDYIEDPNSVFMTKEML